MSTQDLIREMRNKRTGVATPVQTRSQSNEFFGSLVWLYAKMITPLLLLTGGAAFGAIYWRMFVQQSELWHNGFFILAMLFIGINAIVMIFAQTDYDGFKGIELSRSQAPAIWAEIDRISARASCPPISRLLIDNEFNASASTRKGETRKSKRELEVTIGLPLLAALTPLECSTVIAHEIGHHHGDDARRMLVIHAAAVRANHIVDMRDSGLWIMCLPTTLIFSLYLKILHRLSINLSQKCEYDADAFAAAVCGVDACARADVAINVFADDVHEILWKPVGDAYQNGTDIPDNIFEGLPERFSQVLKSEEFQQKLSTALSEETDPGSTHPSMKDRLAHIGARPSLPTFNPQTVAAKVWLGENHDYVVAELQKHWLEDFNREWGDQFEYKRDRRDWALRIFDGTEAVLAQRPDDRDAWFARASFASEIMSYEDSRALTEQAASSCPGEPDIEMMLAKYALGADEAEGVSTLLQMVESNTDCMSLAAYSLLADAIERGNQCADDYPNTAALFESDELKELVAKLKKPAETIYREQAAWPECAVQRADFEPWQQRAIDDFCRYYETVARLWIFRAAEPLPHYLPRYFFVIGYEDGLDQEDCEAFDEDFDSADIPLRGVICDVKLTCSERKPLGSIKKALLPQAVAEIINETAPHFDKWTDKENVSQQPASRGGEPMAAAA